MRDAAGFALLAVVAGLLLMAPLLAEDEVAAEQEEPGAWDLVLQMYEKAKEAGEQVPQDVYEWAKSDLDRIGDWEYLVVSGRYPTRQQFETNLNKLGAERWELVWVERTADDTMLVFKRPVKSYLQQVPVSQLLKLVPGGDSADQAE